jgi:putative thioredoxin
MDNLGLIAVAWIISAGLTIAIGSIVPELEIREFVDRLLPTEADLLVKEARSIQDEDSRRAEALYRSSLDSDSQHDKARLGLARLLVERNADAEAEELLNNWLPGEDDEVDRLRAIVLVRRTGTEFGDESSARVRLRIDEKNPERHHELGCVLAAAGKHREALDHLLRAAEADKVLGSEKVREVMVNVFRIIGTRSELTEEYQAKLAKVLY